MLGIKHRSTRRGFHPAGAAVASVLGVALGLSVTLLPSAAVGAAAPVHLSTATPTATTPPRTRLTTTTSVTSAPTSTAPPSTAAPTTAAPTTAPPLTAVPTTAAPKPPSTPATAPPSTTTTTAAPSTANRAAALPSPPNGAAGHYAFLASDQGRPVRYDPCQPIHYTANLAEGPANALADLKEAIRRVSAASGLTFVYDGESTEVPTSHRELHGANDLPTGWPPVIVAWARPSETDVLTKGSVGEGGSTWSGFPGHEVYVTGLVVVDSTQNSQLAAGFGGRSLGALLMHELGHLVGLDHVNDATQMMYPTVTGKPAVYGAGDLAGLEQLGADQGCVRP
jgi:hypothetical protein